MLGQHCQVYSQTTASSADKNCCIQWEPITSGFQEKFRTRDGKFLRANWGVPPWRISVTHDVAHRNAIQDWVLWDVLAVDTLYFASNLSNYPSYSEDFACSDSGSTVVSFSTMNAMDLFQKAKTVRLRSHHDKYLLAEDDEEGVYQDRYGTCKSAIWTVEVLENAGVLRLKSCYGKYLAASNMPHFFGVTGKKVLQSLPRRLDSSLEWEPIREGIQVKLKTRYGHYLRANGGMPPWRNSITHDIPHRSSTQDWILWDVDIVEFQKLDHNREPTSEQTPAPVTRERTQAQQPPQHAQPQQPKQHFRGQPPPPPPQHVKEQRQPLPQQHFRVQEPPPQRVRVQAQHSPQCSTQPPPPPHLGTQSPPSPQQHFRAQPPPPPPHLRAQTPLPNVREHPPKINFVEKPLSEPTSPSSFSLKQPQNEVDCTFRPSPMNEGRLIVYEVVDDDGSVDKSKGELSFTFKGSGVEQLKEMVKEVSGLNDIIVCSRNPLNGKPYPLRLHLPPNNTTMNLVVVPSTSKLARDLQ